MFFCLSVYPGGMYINNNLGCSLNYVLQEVLAENMAGSALLGQLCASRISMGIKGQRKVGISTITERDIYISYWLSSLTNVCVNFFAEDYK